MMPRTEPNLLPVSGSCSWTVHPLDRPGADALMEIMVETEKETVTNCYRVTPILDDLGRPTRCYRLEKWGGPGDEYMVCIRAGDESCSCMDAGCRKRFCKHILALRELLNPMGTFGENGR
jgi:hypothetical protein